MLFGVQFFFFYVVVTFFFGAEVQQEFSMAQQFLVGNLFTFVFFFVEVILNRHGKRGEWKCNFNYTEIHR